MRFGTIGTMEAEEMSVFAEIREGIWLGGTCIVDRLPFTGVAGYTKAEVSGMSSDQEAKYG